jgi:hypothetical protein
VSRSSFAAFSVISFVMLSSFLATPVEYPVPVLRSSHRCTQPGNRIATQQKTKKREKRTHKTECASGREAEKNPQR